MKTDDNFPDPENSHFLLFLRIDGALPCMVRDYKSQLVQSFTKEPQRRRASFLSSCPFLDTCDAV